MQTFQKLFKNHREAVFFYFVMAALLLPAFYLLFKVGLKANDASAVGELLLVIVLGIGEILAFHELRHLSKERELQSWLSAQTIWTTPSFRESRKKLFDRLDSKNTVWSEPEKEEALDICRRLDEFAQLMPYLGKEKMLRVWDDPIAKMWIVLQGIVIEERTRTRWHTKWNCLEELSAAAWTKIDQSFPNQLPNYPGFKPPGSA